MLRFEGGRCQITGVNIIGEREPIYTTYEERRRQPLRLIDSDAVDKYNARGQRQKQQLYNNSHSQ